MGGNNDKEPPKLNISMIGESLYLFYLYISRNIYTKSKEKQQNNQIFDYCNFNYEFNSPIEDQINNIFKIYHNNKKERKINTKEVLLVQVYKFNTLMKRIYKEMEKLEEPEFMPLVLFLVDFKRDLCSEEEYYEEDLNYSGEGDYYCHVAIPSSPKIDKFTVFISYFIYNKDYLFESEEKECTENGENKFEEIKNILLRFYSFHNDLGERFSIGNGNKKIKYDLTKYYYLNTFNICCIGRTGRGKSTFINYILNDTKAKIFNKREEFTKKVNYYQKTAEPIKLYEIPGFNDKLSVSNSASKLFELMNELNSIKDEIHIILFFFK